MRNNTQQTFKGIRIFLLFCLLFCSASELIGQNLVIKRFYHAERDFTANSGSTCILDQNGEPCALIKIRPDKAQRGFTFDPGRLFSIEKTEEQCESHPMEIYVWVQNGVKRISIGHPQLGNIFEYELGTTLQAGQTYILELTTGVVKTIIEPARTQQYVVFQLTPPDAIVRLDGQMLKTIDGVAQKFMDFGTYNYVVEAPDYEQMAGRIEVNDPKNKHVINVKLKPNFVSVTLTAPSGVEIWVNGEKKGTTSWTGNLGAGAYLFEAKKTGHRDSQISRSIDASMGPQKITLPAPTPIKGEANITSEPGMANIYIDGENMGQTPLLISDLLIGSHSIKVSRNGYKDYNGFFEISENEQASLNIKLNKISEDKTTLKKQEVVVQPKQEKQDKVVEPQPEKQRVVISNKNLDKIVRKARTLMEDVQNLVANRQRTQKENIELQKKLKECKDLIAPALTVSESYKEKANAWDVQSKLCKFTFSPLLDKVIAKQPTDTLALYQNIIGSLNAMEECFKEELASGKEPVYSKFNEVDVERFRPYIAYCGQMFFTNKQYSKAAEAFSVWMDYCQHYTILAENAANLIADPQTAQIAYFTCLCAYFAKDYPTLNKYISQAKYYEEEIDNVNQLYAAALIEQGDTVSWAAELHKQAIAHPNNEAPIQNLLAYYFNNKKEAEAAKFAKELINADPNNKLANYAMGVAFMNTNKFEQAIPYFDKAIEVDPEYTDAYYNAGICYSNYGYYLNEKLNGKKMTQAQYNKAIEPVKSQYRKAEPYFLKVKKMMPNKPDMWASRLSTIYYILGNKVKQAEMDKLLDY